VNYAVAGQGVGGLSVGEWKQTQAPKMDRDVLDLIEKRRIPVYVVAEDLADRGIEHSELVPGDSCCHGRRCPGSSTSTRWSPTGSTRRQSRGNIKVSHPIVYSLLPSDL